MDPVMAKAIQTIVNSQFTQNKEEISKSLLDGISESDSKDVAYAKIINNSMQLSVNMSVQITTELLMNAGLLKPADEDTLRRSLLSVVKD